MKDDILTKLNNCYLLICKELPHSIFHVEDIQLSRLQKLHRILNKKDIKIKTKYKNIKDKIIFEQDWNNLFFNISNDFWLILYRKFDSTLLDVYRNVRDVIANDIRLKDLKYKNDCITIPSEISDETIFETYTPEKFIEYNTEKFKEFVDNKLLIIKLSHLNMTQK